MKPGDSSKTCEGRFAKSEALNEEIAILDEEFEAIQKLLKSTEIYLNWTDTTDEDDESFQRTDPDKLIVLVDRYHSLAKERDKRKEELVRLRNSFFHRHTMVPCQQRKGRSRNRGCPRFQILTIFSWFCCPQNRDIVDLARADLKRDLSAMRKDKLGELTIKAAILWRIFGIVIPILWDASTRIVVRILPVAKFVTKLKSLL